ncbi:chromate resistance transporter [Rhizocola hellebori]|uniref:Chromate resistance transporter n=2 Tax=Rhizocola hellebori TaxID=1392758 RepID=A0A8J3VF69_9ACTN|nr:chromate resistance transporter [Rhizocola hellebori]
MKVFLGYFLGLGAWGFGGPIATVGYMQRDLVERRKWLSPQDFLDGVALGQAMPGPLAAQVVMWLGFLRARSWGALAAAIAFIAPSFVVVLAVAVAYGRYQGSSLVQALFYGIAPAVMAIIAIAAYKLARMTNRRDWRLWTISVVLAVATAWTGTEIALLFLGSGFVMILVDAPPRWFRRRDRPALTIAPVAAIAWPVKALAAATGAGTLLTLAWFFAKAGALTFGSGLAIVPFLRDGAVHQYHWLTDAQFLDAVAMGLITPGPVVITATFVGYLAAGWQGAIVATVAIFTPIFLGVVLPGPWFLRHRDNAQIQAFVKGATAAAAGAIAGVVVVLSQQIVTDWATAGIAVATLAVLLRWKIKEPYVVAAGAIAGIILHWPW